MPGTASRWHCDYRNGRSLASQPLFSPEIHSLRCPRFRNKMLECVCDNACASQVSLLPVFCLLSAVLKTCDYFRAEERHQPRPSAPGTGDGEVPGIGQPGSGSWMDLVRPWGIFQGALGEEWGFTTCLLSALSHGTRPAFPGQP